MLFILNRASLTLFLTVSGCKCSVVSNVPGVTPGPPITLSLITTLLIIFKSLDLNIPDHTMFWAACNLAYFGFLRCAEFTVPTLASSSPDVHLSLEDIAVNSYEVPTLLRVCLKASKTDPFLLCAVQSLIVYLNVGERGLDLWSFFKMADLYLGRLLLIGFVGFSLQLVSLAPSQAIPFVLGWRLWLLAMEFLII